MTVGPGTELGVGIDIESIERFSSPDPRLFTPAELQLCESSSNAAESRAGRWCAKEAVVKAAARFVLLSPRDVEVLSHADGRPRVTLLRQEVANMLECEASITHGHGFAAAVATAWRREPGTRLAAEETR